MTEQRDCILFATADWDAPYWTNKQHTASQLAKLGFRVLYVESVGLRTPTVNRKDLSRIWRRLIRGVRPPRAAAKNIWVFSPLIIPFKHHWSWVRAINQGILSWQLKRFSKRKNFRAPIVWTYHPFILQTLHALTHQKLIYHCVDDLSAVPGINTTAFNREEQHLLANCDAVFTTSETLYERCVIANANTHHFANVADAEHFGKARQSGAIPSELAAIPHPRIGYVGALSDYKVDFELILSVATQHPEWHWVLIGDEREGQKNAVVEQLRALSNVHFLGYRPYATLPDYLRGFDIATLPSLLNDYTRAMFPMKYFEYLAAGLPIVTTPLEFTRHHTAGLVVSNSADEFAQGIAMQLARGRLADTDAEQFVADHTWEVRLQKMLIKADITA